jgi:hypothetical protein
MKCPYCDANMIEGYKNTKPITPIFSCPGNGRLLTKESGQCKYQGVRLTKEEIEGIIVALIDIDTDE